MPGPAGQGGVFRGAGSDGFEAGPEGGGDAHDALGLDAGGVAGGLIDGVVGP